MSAQPQLYDTVHQLAFAAPDRIEVDVGALTFAGSVLPNFLVRLQRAVPAESMLTVSRPSPLTYLILDVTGMADVASIQEPVPAQTQPWLIRDRNHLDYEQRQ